MLAFFMFIPAFITATMTAFLCGILLKYGLVGFISVSSTIVIGDLLSNIFWYMAGRIGGTVFIATFGDFFGIKHDHIVNSMDIFNKYKDYVSFFVAAPVGMAIMAISLMNAGIQRFAFWKYIISNTLTSIVWIWLMLAFGYSFGYAYSAFVSLGGRIVVSLVLLVVLFILITLGAWIRTLIMPNLYKGVPTTK